MRGFLDVIVVALSVAFGIRALFVQPFKIPTSSMQPTLFGIHYVDEAESQPYRNGVINFFLPLGMSKAELTPGKAGFLREGASPFRRSVADMLSCVLDPLNCYWDASRVAVGDILYTLPGSDVRANIYRYLDFNPEKKFFQEDETVFKGYLSAGDHLFVDRMSIHFLPLERGDVFVFNTENLRGSNGLPLSGYYYIKRLVGLPGDTLKIQNHVLYIRPRGETEFKRSDEFSPKFSKIYSGQGGYQGYNPAGLLAEGREYTVPEDHFFALGDNTANSYDSRYWGPVPRENIVGRALNIFWPVSRRWGWVDRLPPLNVPTVTPESTTQPSAMRLQ